MMEPNLKGTGFGWIDVGEERFSHDIIIRFDGEVAKRKKKLTKDIYGTSHNVSLPEAKYTTRKGQQAC